MRAAARRIGVDRSTLRRAVEAGHIATVPFGARQKLRVEDVDAYARGEHSSQKATPQEVSP